MTFSSIFTPSILYYSNISIILIAFLKIFPMISCLSNNIVSAFFYQHCNICDISRFFIYTTTRYSVRFLHSRCDFKFLKCNISIVLIVILKMSSSVTFLPRYRTCFLLLIRAVFLDIFLWDRGTPCYTRLLQLTSTR